MAWTTPYTAVSSNTITASNVNQTRDNLNELRATPQNRCSAYHNTTQVVNSGNTDSLSLNTDDIDTAAIHDVSTDNTKFTIPSGGGGTYLIFGSTHVENAAATPTVSLHLRVNGSSTIRTRTLTIDPSIALRFQSMDISALWSLSAGDYIELRGQAASANVTFGSATQALATRLEIIGPLPPS